MMDKIFLETIKKYKLIKKRDRVILGVSGGPDSVCMLYLFEKIRKELKLDMVCAHFNHSLREEADSDEEFVKSLAEALKIKFISAKKDVRKFFKGDSLEQTARLLRFDFFFSCSRRFRIKKIALAHNRDDVVETVLMRILRGTALRGLRGILPKYKYKSITIIRPLVDIDKEYILEWLAANNISYRIDNTNLEDKFFRNKIRNKILPLLSEFNPNIKNAFFNLAKSAGFDYDFLYSYSFDKFNALKKTSSGLIKLDLERLKDLHPAIIMGVLRIAFEEIKGNLRRLELRHFDEILELISYRPRGSVVHLPGIEIRKEDNLLIIKSLIL